MEFDRRPPIAIRRADPEDASRLTELAHAAKRHWGYKEEWIRLWRAELTFEPEFIRSHDVFVATPGDAVAGVYALLGEGDPELEHFWIDPGWMGRGIGRKLFEHMLATLRAAGERQVKIASDPYAESFYLKMGARRIGSVASRPAGRTLPLLVVELAA